MSKEFGVDDIVDVLFRFPGFEDWWRGMDWQMRDLVIIELEERMGQ